MPFLCVFCGYRAGINLGVHNKAVGNLEIKHTLFQSLDLWEARPRFQTIGLLGSTSKLQSIGPLGSMSKFKSTDLWEAHPKFNLWTSGKHVQTSIHRTSGKHVQISNPWTSGTHVQNFKSIRPLVSISCTYFLFFQKKKKKKVLHAWTTFKLDPPTKRYVGNLPQDSIHILI